MGRKLSTEEFIRRAKTVHGDKYDYSLANYADAKTKIEIICSTCGNSFKQTPNNHLNGKGCPYCNGSIRKTTEEFIKQAKEIHGDKYDYAKTIYKNNEDKVLIKCNECGNEFYQIAKNHLNGEGCPKCANKKRAEKNTYTWEEIIERAREIHGEKYDYSKYVYGGIFQSGIIKCRICDNEFPQTMNAHVNNKEGCPYCGKEKFIKSRILTTEEFIERAREKHGNKYDYSLVQYKDYDNEVKIICPKHGVFTQTPDSHLQGKGCQKCGQIMSKAEDELYEYLTKVLNIEVERHNRTVIAPYEIDLYIPSLKIGIEYNGLLWHSEKYKNDRNYHNTKTDMGKEHGIKLIQIFEDEYLNNKDIVLSKISHILKKDKGDKVFARKCVVKEITYKESADFLNLNHIQGESKATIYLGLFDDKKMVSVMNFMKQGNNEWELSRFASDIYCNVIGAGGKLFKYFIKHYNPVLVKSFADRRWTIDEDKNLYTEIRFYKDKILPPDYRYYKPNGGINRIHKFNFRKKALNKKFDLSYELTEREMADKLGYYRIYDCGLIKYVWKKEN